MLAVSDVAVGSRQLGRLIKDLNETCSVHLTIAPGRLGSHSQSATVECVTISLRDILCKPILANTVHMTATVDGIVTLRARYNDA